MRKFFLLFLCISMNIYAQFDDYPMQNEGYLAGGLGLIWIDGQPHYKFNLRPEFSFADFGVGFDLNLEFNSEGKIRKENFNEFSDYLSVIRYVRYGYKNDPVFVKLGALDYYTLGHGTIINQYNNSPSYDTRKIGLSTDIDFGKFGFESIYGNFAQAGLFGLRAYARPLLFTEAAEIPIIGGVEVGLSFASDFNEYAGIVDGDFNSVQNKFQVVDDKGSINIIGFDLGFPLLSTPFTDLLFYFDYNKIFSFGSGIATGLKLDLSGLGLVELSAKLERRFNQDQYLPSYFNSLYEIERFRVDTINNSFSSKALILKNSIGNSDGFYGDLLVRVLGIFDIYGAYQRLDEFPKSGILNLRTQISPEDAPVIARAGYDKINILDGSDLFKLDDRSYLFFELGYKPIDYIIVSLVYHWTFTPVRDSGEKIIDYKSQKRIEPRVSLVYPIIL